MPDSRDPGPSTLLQKAHLAARFGAVVAAAFPTTSLIPLPLTQLATRRFQREEALKKLHLMVHWAQFCTTQILKARIDVQGREHLPSPSRGHMFVSNHQSYTDIVVLIPALDTVAFLSKRVPVRYLPAIGRSAYCAGTVYIDRSNPESREKALQETLRMCEESVAVVVFPEGTRSERGELREKIHPRAMQVAHERGLRLVPVGLHGTHRIIPKTNDRIGVGQHVAVRIAPPLDPAGFSDGESYAEACWSEVARLHGEARDAVRKARC